MVLSLSALAQEEKVCNQLPYAKVDVKAALTTDLTAEVEKNMIKSLEKDGDHKAMIKLYVDCNGVIDKPSYHNGTFNTDQQNWILGLVEKTEWTAAKLGDKDVTSTVFLVVYVTNGHARVAIQ